MSSQQRIERLIKQVPAEIAGQLEMNLRRLSRDLISDEDLKNNFREHSGTLVEAACNAITILSKRLPKKE